MSAELPDFLIRLPDGGPTARGRLLGERSPNGGEKFLVYAHSPVRLKTAPAFERRRPAAYKLRQELLRENRIIESTTWPGYLETAEDIVFRSPTAAGVVLGRHTNGWTAWRTEDGIRCSTS